MSDYPERFRVLDEHVDRASKLFACLDPHFRKALGLDEDTVTRYEEFCLTKDLKGDDCYTFTVRISVREGSAERSQKHKKGPGELTPGP